MLGDMDEAVKYVKQLQATVKEVMKLYDISEAEEHIIMEMAILVRSLGLSQSLTLKCLQALTTTMEMVTDEMRRNGQLKND